MKKRKKKIVAEPEVTEAVEPTEAPAADGAAAAEVTSPHKGFLGKVDNYFGITKSGSKFKVEIVAGLTTFMAMVYILLLNGGVFASASGSYGAAYIATAIGAIAGTLLMALFAKMPFGAGARFSA